MPAATAAGGAAGLDVGVEADEDRREADEAVEAGDELGHLGHLHPRRDDGADAPPSDDRQQDQQRVALTPGPKMVASTASAMPTMPYQMARLAFSWLESPPSARMKRTAAAM